jgi:hypothetical protein
MNTRQAFNQLAAVILLVGIWNASGSDLILATQVERGLVQLDGGLIQVDSSPMRTWSSPDGKLQREARLTEIRDKVIRLEMEPGKSTLAQIERLSQPDQDFVATERRRIVESNRRLLAVMEPDNAAGGSSSVFASGKEIGVFPDFRSVPTVELKLTPKVSINRAEWEPKPQPPKRVRVAAFDSFSPTLTGFSRSPAGKKLAVSLRVLFGVNLDQPPSVPSRRGESNKGPVKAWAEIIDLDSLRTQVRLPLVDQLEYVAAVNDEGNLVATIKARSATAPQAMIYSVTDKKLVREKVWNVEAQGENQATVEGAYFLPDQRLLMDYMGYLIVMKLDPIQAVLKIPNDQADWAISLDSTQVMVSSGGKRYLVELATGNCLGSVESELSTNGLSPDRTRYARYEPGTIVIRNLKAEVLDEFFFPLPWGSIDDLSWIDDHTLSVRSSLMEYYVDVDRRVVFAEAPIRKLATRGRSTRISEGQQRRHSWRYESVTDLGQAFLEFSNIEAGSRLDPKIAVFQRQLPKSAESLLLLKPAQRVNVTWNLESDPSLESAIQSKVTELLNQRGVIIDPAGTVELRVKSAPRNSRVKYHFTNPAGEVDPNKFAEVGVRIVEQSLELIVEGEVAWALSNTIGPNYVLRVLPTETPQQAVDRQQRTGKEFWQSLKLPRHLAKHPKGQAWNRLEWDSGSKRMELRQ